jgi:hypothetical protein
VSCTLEGILEVLCLIVVGKYGLIEDLPALVAGRIDYADVGKSEHETLHDADETLASRAGLRELTSGALRKPGVLPGEMNPSSFTGKS